MFILCGLIPFAIMSLKNDRVPGGTCAKMTEAQLAGAKVNSAKLFEY